MNIATINSVKGRAAIVAGLAIVVGGAWKLGLIPSFSSGKSVVPVGVELTQSEGPTSPSPITASMIGPCGSGLAKVGGPKITMSIWAWNAQMALIGANCGPKTMSGSLMEKHGVNLNLVRQDDTEKSKIEQIKFATQIAGGNPNPGDGAAFVVIMGDGASQYLADVNKKLTKLGPDYHAEIVGAVGFSGNKVSGEDAFEGPSEWKDSPERAKGGLVAGVLRDGDWNIAQAWLNANGIPNNPDEKYYDPTALNWVSADDYIKAAELYIAGHCEDRYVVKDGKVTSEKRNVCVQGVVTWTPGDVMIAKKKGGLVKLLSTKENYMQMPAVVIGIKAWDMAHAKQVEGLLAATFEMSDQIRAYPEQILPRAAKASYAVYNEESAGYWAKYYRGVIERDATGQPVPLGGSRVAGYEDNRFLFGMSEDVGLSNSAFNAAYAGFGKVASTQYPKVLPSFPPTSDAVNLTFLNNIAGLMGHGTKADVPTFETTDSIAPENTVAKQNVNIQFETGSANFTPQAQATLDRLFNQLSNAASLNVEIDGHTDNTGDDTVNIPLSERRANMVKSYFMSRNRRMFPEERVSTHGYGSTKPVADNATPEGRLKNRRVTIILGTN